ncbi:MAG TPA: FMN-binding protein [Terriglobales bacterium]|nr:FMN-binding protein [Terriglobales bacterium]
MKKFLKVILILLVAIGLILAGTAIFFSRGLDAGRKVEISPVDPTALSDGTYTGTYTNGRWANELAVTVQGGKITDIEVVKDVQFGTAEVSDEVFRRVIEAQNVTIDVVAQATVTTKAYLKSIENALTK